MGAKRPMKWFHDLHHDARVFVIFLSIMFGMTMFIPIMALQDFYFSAQTNQATIKAGLVQDDKGHWVKPKACP